MQITIDVPDSLPLEFLKLRIQEIEQNLKSEAKTFAIQQAEITKGDKTNVVKLSASCLKNWSAIASAIACKNS